MLLPAGVGDLLLLCEGTYLLGFTLKQPLLQPPKDSQYPSPGLFHPLPDTLEGEEELHIITHPTLQFLSLSHCTCVVSTLSPDYQISQLSHSVTQTKRQTLKTLKIVVWESIDVFVTHMQFCKEPVPIQSYLTPVTLSLREHSFWSRLLNTWWLLRL